MTILFSGNNSIHNLPIVVVAGGPNVVVALIVVVVAGGPTVVVTGSGVVGGTIVVSGSIYSSYGMSRHNLSRGLLLICKCGQIGSLLQSQQIVLALFI